MASYLQTSAHQVVQQHLSITLAVKTCTTDHRQWSACGPDQLTHTTPITVLLPTGLIEWCHQYHLYRIEIQHYCMAADCLLTNTKLHACKENSSTQAQYLLTSVVEEMEYSSKHAAPCRPGLYLVLIPREYTNYWYQTSTTVTYYQLKYANLHCW